MNCSTGSVKPRCGRRTSRPNRCRTGTSHPRSSLGTRRRSPARLISSRCGPRPTPTAWACWPRPRARRQGWTRAGRGQLRIAGWLHDLGRVAVPNLIWDKPGTLERRPSGNRCACTPTTPNGCWPAARVLAPVAALAGAAHERGDGSGYIKSLRSTQLDTRPGCWRPATCTPRSREDRPHRPAFSAEAAAELLTDEAARARLDLAAVRHVLDAAGRRAASRIGAWPAGLTDREVEVLRLVAHGGTNKDVARSARHLASHRAAPRRAHLHQDRRDEPGRRGLVRRRARPRHPQR